MHIDKYTKSHGPGRFVSAQVLTDVDRPLVSVPAVACFVEVHVFVGDSALECDFRLLGKGGEFILDIANYWQVHKEVKVIAQLEGLMRLVRMDVEDSRTKGLRLINIVVIAEPVFKLSHKHEK